MNKQPSTGSGQPHTVNGLRCKHGLQWVPAPAWNFSLVLAGRGMQYGTEHGTLQGTCRREGSRAGVHRHFILYICRLTSCSSELLYPLSKCRCGGNTCVWEHEWRGKPKDVSYHVPFFFRGAKDAKICAPSNRIHAIACTMPEYSAEYAYFISLILVCFPRFFRLEL